jgi:bifunctional UDP-N-acetylglucosamine pyrophosphorylase/glucosamine-1-phosphate N-acetyltransferase
LTLPGDSPFITGKILKEMIERHKNSRAAATLLTSILPDPGSYGRIIRDYRGKINKIIEMKDASYEELKIREVNSGTYCFKSKHLKKLLPELDKRNVQGEYYLTDVIGLLSGRNLLLETIVASDQKVVLGVNNRAELALALKEFQEIILERHMLSGVTIIDPKSTFIDITVKIGRDTIIYPYCFIEKETIIGENCAIGPHAKISGCKIEDKVKIESSVLVDSNISAGETVLPFSYIKENKKI